MPKKAPFELPDKDCERLTRTEMHSVIVIMVLASDLHFAKEDLKKRLQSVPSGMERMNMVLGQIDSLFRDIIGTVSNKQRKQIRNQARDTVMKQVPKLSASGQNVMVHVDEIKELVECAREKCRMCVMDNEECRECRLYQWLEGNIPLDDYGDGLICPYAEEEWGV